MIPRALVVLALAGMSACGENLVELDPDEEADADVDGTCVAGDTQCTNCDDDDGDGEVDGFDVECSGAIDDDESSFDTDVPGDNGPADLQDCLFDGNSGSDEGCSRHVCCILDLDGPACDAAGIDNNFDPATDCPDQSQMCLDECAPLVPPGCDCFGCCNICDETSCYDIYIHPAIAPDCDADVLADQDLCPRCVPIPSCGTGCDGGGDDCETSADCGDGQFCAAGCCITVVD